MAEVLETMPGVFTGGLVYQPAFVSFELRGGRWEACGSGETANGLLERFPWAVVLPVGERPGGNDRK